MITALHLTPGLPLTYKVTHLPPKNIDSNARSPKTYEGDQGPFPGPGLGG